MAAAPDNPGPQENPVQDDATEISSVPVSLPEPSEPASSSIGAPITFGENFAKKVRKHIDQIRHREPVPEAIPSPGKGGIERVEQIIRERVGKGNGRATSYAGEAAVAYEDGGVTYIFRPNGEFWTILGN